MPVSLGESARVLVGNVIFCVQKGTVTENPPEIPTTCTESGKGQTRTRGRENLEVSLEAQWNPQANPFKGTPRIKAGKDVPNVFVYPDFENDTSTFWFMPLAYVAQASCTIDAEGVQAWSLQLKNQGDFTSPAEL